MKKIVIKIGSSVIAPQGKLKIRVMRNILEEVVKLEDKGIKSIIVSSGAIVCGVNRLKEEKKKDIHSLQAYASLGQVILMEHYSKILKKYNKTCAQILLTWDDFNDRRRFLNAQSTINRLLKWGVIPIINENDTVSYEEIKLGDNDKLSALVSDLIRADLLIILSDVEGLFSPQGLVRKIEKIDNKVISWARKEEKEFRRGGMITKLEAAKIATSSGIKTIIANGRKKNIITNIIEGKEEGTTFLPLSKVEKAKKRWIAFSKKVKGKIFIDEGAKKALIEKGKSLLSCGIIKVEGEFLRKDAVHVVDSCGSLVGVGLVEYSSDELKDKTKKFEREVIHRDNFVKKEEEK